MPYVVVRKPDGSYIFTKDGNALLVQNTETNDLMYVPYRYDKEKDQLKITIPAAATSAQIPDIKPPPEPKVDSKPKSEPKDDSKQLPEPELKNEITEPKTESEPLSVQNNDEKKEYNWKKCEKMEVLDLYKQFEKSIGPGKKFRLKKHLLAYIADSLKKKFQSTATIKQIDNKLFALERAFRNVVDHITLTGRDTKKMKEDPEIVQLCEAIWGKKKKSNPDYTLSEDVVDTLESREESLRAEQSNEDLDEDVDEPDEIEETSSARSSSVNSVTSAGTSRSGSSSSTNGGKKGTQTKVPQKRKPTIASEFEKMRSDNNEHFNQKMKKIEEYTNAVKERNKLLDDQNKILRDFLNKLG